MNPGDIGKVQLEVPAEIMQAAQKVQAWAIANNIKHWQIGGVCARSYAIAIQEYVPKLLRLTARERIIDVTALQEHNLARHALMMMVWRDDRGNVKGN